jgi:threonine/homoserine/homoserine lactone efflux protein
MLPDCRRHPQKAPAVDRTSLLVFAAAYLAALILPGPGVTALVARVLSRGTHGASAYIAGFVAGSLLWFTIAATGLAVLASTFAAVFVAIRYAGAVQSFQARYRR